MSLVSKPPAHPSSQRAKVVRPAREIVNHAAPTCNFLVPNQTTHTPFIGTSPAQGYTLHTSEELMATSQEDQPRSPSNPSEEGDHDLASSLYQELHRLAVMKMRFERGDHTLQPTALVNEAYLRLVGESDSMWQDRTRVLGLAANVMRHILVDYARAHRAEKRGDGQVQVTLIEEMVEGANNSTADILAIDEALTRLTAFDSRQANILEMHFFAGLTFDEIALELGISTRTVKRDWTMARAWLRHELSAWSKETAPGKPQLPPAQ